MAEITTKKGRYQEIEDSKAENPKEDVLCIDVFDLDIPLIVELLEHEQSDNLLNALANEGLISFENYTIAGEDIVEWYERPSGRDQVRCFVVKLITQMPLQ
jgi:hypothetical protein